MMTLKATSMEPNAVASSSSSISLHGFALRAVSACVAEAATFPMDTIKMRIQLQGEGGGGGGGG
eukprot:CAMPEP_0197582900 /NCGR_PEP_ID=MMETSP1326-20131121/5986_1 /TAXON_ID=1155430 /ORGANISM="Genus nov. species nov., Strain RCC2288" /LENGTH=63 /DNA_ID=CAMNT_0043147047 /DNA_START=135 /DNA_END=322 /DNA_ORIENTATION=-